VATSLIPLAYNHDYHVLAAAQIIVPLGEQLSTSESSGSANLIRVRKRFRHPPSVLWQ
jgi:hypothetical protein